MTVKNFFNGRQVFRFEEFRCFMLDQTPSVTDKNCYMTLYNYCRSGRLTHIRKGLYAVNSDNEFQSSIISPLLIASCATTDALLAYHTALESHGVSYTHFNEHTYLTARRTTAFSFQNQHYQPIYKPKAQQKKSASLGIEKIKLSGTEVRRTSLERTIVDVLDRPDLSGGWEEVIRSLDRVTIFDVAFAIDYALSFERASLIAKLGYFIEQRPDYLKVETKFSDYLLPHIPKQVYYIDRNSTEGNGIYFKKWQLIVPKYIHERQWEEPEHDFDN